jgi:hypothetical protein
MAKHVRADKLDPKQHLVVEDGKPHRVVSVHKSASKPGGNLMLNITERNIFDLTVQDGEDIIAALRQAIGKESVVVVRAADLPDGSIIAARNVVYIKNRPSTYSQWCSTRGAYLADSLVDQYLHEGATVLRVGYGEGESR